MSKTTSAVILFTVTAFLGQTCSDKRPTQPIETPFGVRIQILDSGGVPVPGLLVSTWTDTVVIEPEQSRAALLLQATDASLYGDVNCDGRAFTIWDVEGMMYYLTNHSRLLTEEQWDCLESHGNLVPATKGVTVADFAYLFMRFNYTGIPDGRTLRYGEMNYLYDDSTGILSFPYPTEVQALFLTYEQPGFSWPYIANWETKQIDYLYGSDSSYYYTLVWTVGSLGGDVVKGFGKLHSIEAAGRYGQPLHLTRIAHDYRIAAWDTDLSDSVVEFRLFNEIKRPAEIKVFDLENLLVEDTVVVVGPNWPIAWEPDSLYSTVYRFEMEVVEAEGLIVRDTSYGVFWTDDPERTTVGKTNSEGEVIVNDIRLFPSLFELPTLRVADTTYPYYGTPFVFSDSVTFHVRNTSTGEFKEQRFMISHGRNDITIPWP